MGKDSQQKTSGIAREFSSGGVVYKGDKWFIRRTAPSKEFPKSYWMLPKGWIDEGESLEQTAIREVEEEGGVKAKIVKKLGTIKYFFKHPERGNIIKFVTYFLMEWVRDLPDGPDFETAEVAWLSFKEAKKKLSFRSEKDMLAKAKMEGSHSGLVRGLGKLV